MRKGLAYRSSATTTVKYPCGIKLEEILRPLNAIWLAVSVCCIVGIFLYEGKKSRVSRGMPASSRSYWSRGSACRFKRISIWVLMQPRGDGGREQGIPSREHCANQVWIPWLFLYLKIDVSCSISTVEKRSLMALKLNISPESNIGSSESSPKGQIPFTSQSTSSYPLKALNRSRTRCVPRWGAFQRRLDCIISLSSVARVRRNSAAYPALDWGWIHSLCLPP